MAKLSSIYKKEKGLSDPIQTDRNTILRIFFSIIPKVEMFAINSRIFAKESASIPMMAKDNNIVSQNISKLVKFYGIKPALKSDSYFEKTSKRGSDYQSMFQKESDNRKLKGPSVVGVSEFAQKAVDYGAISLGIVGFVGALALAGNLINSLPGGYEGVKNMLVALAEGLQAFSLKSFLMFSALLAGGALFGTVAGIEKSIGGGLGIAAVGLGIGGFFAGLSVGGAIADFIGNSAGIKEMMINFAEGLQAFDPETFKEFSILLGAGAVFGTVASFAPSKGAAAAAGAMLGMGMIGTGIGLFFSGLSIGGAIGNALSSDPTMIKDLLVNVAGGLNAVATIEGMELIKLVPILPVFGLALASFLALEGVGKVIQTLGDGLSKALNFVFGTEDERSPLQKVIDDVSAFSSASVDVAKIGQGFNDLMNSIKILADLTDEEINKALLNGKMILLLVESLSKGDSSILKKLPLAENNKPIITPEQTKVDGVSESLVAYIKRTEGFTAKATWDNKQYTNGYGTEAKSPDEVITETEADRRLRESLQKTQDYVSSYLTKKGYTFNRNQLDALTSFTYNLGPGGLAQLTSNGSRTFDEIRQKMIEYNRSAGQISSGLKRRREEELAMFNAPSATSSESLLNASASPLPMPAQPTTGATVDSSSVDIQQAKLNMNSVPPKIVVNTNTSPSTKKKKDDTKIASTLDSSFNDAMFGAPIL